MDVDPEQQRQQQRPQQRALLRRVLQACDADLTLLEDSHLDKLWDNCYRTVRSLHDASRPGLSDAGLPPGIVDHILALKGAQVYGCDELSDRR